MARLKQLDLGCVCGGFREPPSTDVLTALLCSVLPACPALQGLGFSGRHYLCPKESEQAHLSDATPLPQSLRWLQMTNVTVPAAFPDIQLPALEAVFMHLCGPHETALFDSLRSHASQLPATPNQAMWAHMTPSKCVWRYHYDRPLADNNPV